jgi:hypothetical protein
LEDGSEVDVALESQGRGHLPPLVEEEGSAAVAEENPADAATQAAAPADGDGDGR